VKKNDERRAILMKKYFIISITIVVAIVSFFYVFNFKSLRKIIDKEATSEFRDLNVEFTEIGWVEPRRRIKIVSPFKGRIEKIFVNEGENVKSGQIVALISSNERIVMIDAAKAISQEEYYKWQNIYKTTSIFAPIDGIIILRDKEPGQTICETDNILVMADELLVNLKVNEIDLKYVKLGDRVKLYLDAYPDKTFLGIVEKISYECIITDNVVVYPILIKPLGNIQMLQSGMTVTVTIPIESKKNVLSIPNDFIIENEDTKTVVIKTKKFKFRTRKIETGVTDGNFTEIVSGLIPKETVVIFKPPKNKD
jgi:macrolide-specific efflux system membrane fusion protein